MNIEERLQTLRKFLYHTAEVVAKENETEPKYGVRRRNLRDALRGFAIGFTNSHEEKIHELAAIHPYINMLIGEFCA